MKIHHQGWNDTVGSFNCDVFIDETRCDYTIHFANGSAFHQVSPFEDLTADWEETGEPYPKVGAYFDHEGSREFFTPQELASLVLNGYAVIPGIQIEDRQANLADRIQAATRRANALSAIQPQVPFRTTSEPTL